MQQPSLQPAGGGGQQGENKPPQVQPAVTATNGTNSFTSEYWIRMSPPFYEPRTAPNP
jgi:hypothetical protein